MKTLVYEGPGGQLNLHGRLIPRGEPFDVDNATADMLLNRQPRVRVRDVTPSQKHRRQKPPETTEPAAEPEGTNEDSDAGATDETEVT